MLESLGLTDYQNVLEMDLLSMGRGSNRRIYGRLILSERDGCQDQKGQSEQQSDSNATQAVSLKSIKVT